MPFDVRVLAAELEQQLQAAGTPERAATEKAYLKSSLEFYGTSVPITRRLVKALHRARPALAYDDVISLVETLWDRPVHDCRMAAVEVLRFYADRLREADAALVERLIRQSATWALVDNLAAEVMGQLIERYPKLTRTLDRWSTDDDFWIRRSALLALLPALRRGDGDFQRFSRYADAMLDEREFFIRKAIGWVLRETGRRRPELVADWLAPRAARASGVTMKEALKPLSPEQQQAFMTSYRDGQRTGRSRSAERA